MIACLAFGAATTLGLLLVGPAVMRLLFGPDFDYDRFGLALVGIGTGPVPGGHHGQPGGARPGALAHGRDVAGASSATFFVAFLFASSLEAVREVEVAFLSTAFLLSSLLYLAYRRPVRSRAGGRTGVGRRAGGAAGGGG